MDERMTIVGQVLLRVVFMILKIHTNIKYSAAVEKSLAIPKRIKHRVTI